MEYGLIGKNLNYSYSKIIHEKFGLYKYAAPPVGSPDNVYVVSYRNVKYVWLSAQPLIGLLIMRFCAGTAFFVTTLPFSKCDT